MENFEEATIALLSTHEDRLETIESKFEKFQFALILALKQSGIDLMTALKFVDSKVGVLDVPAAVAPVPPALTPSPSNTISIPTIIPPVTGAGDSVPLGHVPSIVPSAAFRE
jgi:hypothetical protein